jgi:hypothetical protein
MGGRRRSGRVGRSVKVAGLGLASVGLAGAMTLAGAQAAWAQGAGGPGPGGTGGTVGSGTGAGPGPVGSGTGSTGGGPTPPSPCTGAANPPSQTGCSPESLLYYANSSGKPAIVPGLATSMYYLDETPYDTSYVQVLGPSGNVIQDITPTPTPVTSSILNYSELTAFDDNGGSRAPFPATGFPATGKLPSCPTITNGTAPGPPGVCEDLLSFTISSSDLTAGESYSVIVTVYDYDGNSDQITFRGKAPGGATTPVGAVGGALLAVAMGGGLVYVQQRRRRGNARRVAEARG